MPKEIRYHKKQVQTDVVGNKTHYTQEASVPHGNPPPPGEGWSFAHSYTDKRGDKWDMYHRKIDLGHTIKENAAKDAAYERARREASREREGVGSERQSY
jgi:hypothetical protein